MTMATTTVTHDQDAVIGEIYIAAPVERVFQALFDPKQVMLWWTHPDCPIAAFSMETKPGGRWFYDTAQTKINVNGVTKFHCEGEVLEYDPPRVLAYTWIANWHDDKSRRTVVRWELSPQANGTLAKVTHSGLAQERVAREDYTSGWVGVLETLKKFLEN
jgi:uncharacterized protein YndB with AHSA1/START domain